MTNSNVNIEPRRRLFWFLTCLVLVMVGSYFYYVHQTIAGVVDQEEIRRQLGEEGAIVSRLEGQHIEASSKVTMELAKDRGFADPTFESSFAYLNRADRLALGQVSNER